LLAAGWGTKGTRRRYSGCIQRIIQDTIGDEAPMLRPLNSDILYLWFSRAYADGLKASTLKVYASALSKYRLLMQPFIGPTIVEPHLQQLISSITTIYEAKTTRPELTIEQLHTLVKHFYHLQDYRALSALALLWHALIRPGAILALRGPAASLQNPVPIDRPSDIDEHTSLLSNVKLVQVNSAYFIAILVHADKNVQHEPRLTMVPPQWDPEWTSQPISPVDALCRQVALVGNGFILADPRTPHRPLPDFDNIFVDINDTLNTTKLTPYSIRHGAAQRLFDNTADTLAVQMATGHKAQSSVLHYIKNTPKSLLRLFRA
jgi:integrase